MPEFYDFGKVWHCDQLVVVVVLRSESVFCFRGCDHCNNRPFSLSLIALFRSDSTIIPEDCGFGMVRHFDRLAVVVVVCFVVVEQT